MKIKMYKIIFIVGCFISGFIVTLFAEDSSIKFDEEIQKNYKVEREKDYLSCFSPLAIKGINKVYLTNDEGELAYTIEIWESREKCTWETDKILFSESLSVVDQNHVFDNYAQKLYFEGEFSILFKVEKVIDDDSYVEEDVTIPYFVLINDKAKDEIIFRKDLFINIELPETGTIFVMGETIELEDSYDIQDFINLESLSGIYFR